MKQSAKNPKDTPKMLQVRSTVGEIEAAKSKAEKSGLTLSQVVRKLLQDYIADPQRSLISV